MRFKDFVANSLPRVRGRKSKKASHVQAPNHVSVSASQDPDFSTCPRYFPKTSVHDSRESSVERSSTVAVVDAPWRENAVYKSRQNRTRPGDPEPLVYYTSHHPQRGMVVSHSADGISSQASMAVLMTSSRGYSNGLKVAPIPHHYPNAGCQQNDMSALSESAVNYVGPPYCFHHSQHQHQHHHHHHHSHDYHYVYHHHHDRNYQTQAQHAKATPLDEKTHQHNITNSMNTQSQNAGSEKPRKSESGSFLRRSFASFRAMRKQGSRSKEQGTHQNDENEKCMVCPYPQPQSTEGSQRKSSKQSRKGLRSLTKSKKSKNSVTHDHQIDSNMLWYSDNDGKKLRQNHLHNHDALPQFPVQECSMESSVSHQLGADFREGSYIRELDNQCQETVSLSGYDSDVAKSVTGRSRSRIKTNPWLPSPQPSLTMGRKIDNCRHLRESNEDLMDDDNPSCFPRSASFDYHRQLGVSTFLSSYGQDEPKRNIQRHRSLTPVDLKLNLSLPKTKKPEATQSFDKPESWKGNGVTVVKKSPMNDLNTNLTKSRPNSIVSPNSEFIALADNIEQLANNISFEYEDGFVTTVENGPDPAKGEMASARKARSIDEGNAKKRKADLNPFPNEDISDNAHSPDSGIGCLGSCDGDDAIALANASVLDPGSSPTTSSARNVSDTAFPKSSSLNFALNQTNSQKVSDDLSLQNETCSQFTINPDLSYSPGFGCGRQLASSSNESLNSAVVSESDIDNTSYRYAENWAQTSFLADSSKPLNSSGSLMVDERLDVDFRSLPRKGIRNCNKNTGEKNGCRNYPENKSMNVPMESECSSLQQDKKPSSISSREVQSPMKSQMKNRSSFSNEVKNDTTDKKCHGGMELELETIRSSTDRCEGRNSSFVTGENSLSNIVANIYPLSYDLDGRQTHKPRGERDVSMSGQETDSQRNIDRHQPLCEIKDNMEMLKSSKMDAAVSRESDILNNDAEIISVDACVQTDLYFDFDPWERQQSPLPHLDDSFDPVESTRRWLISGNMQGSADTGYSSQPRDSHVFMDEETSFLQFDSLSDNGIMSCQTKPKAKGEPSSIKGKSPSIQEPTQSMTQFPMNSGANPNNLTLTDHQDDNDVVDSSFDGVLSVIESPYQDVFKEIDIRINSGSLSEGNKRHSSDSSTSTLTSDVPVIDNEENQQLSNSRNLTKKEMEEPEYVNLPNPNYCNTCQFTSFHGFTDSRDGSIADTKYETQPCSSCHTLNACSLSSTESANIDSVQQNYVDDARYNDPFGCSENMSHCDEDRADYLEFLRDIPLQKAHYECPVFIIPGFGPIEVSPKLFQPTNVEKDLYLVGNVCCDENVSGYNGSDSFDCVIGHDETISDKRGSSYVSRSKESVALPEADSRKKKERSSKSKKDERPPGLTPLACNGLSNSNTDQSGHCEHNKKEVKSQLCHPSCGKRKTDHCKNVKAERCPTVQSYDVDNFPVVTKRSNLALYSGQCSELSLHPEKSGKCTRDNSTRSLAERVSLLRREKEIIYRKIQEVQQQELSKQREQLQHQRHLHSQRKKELLETLHDLKEKLEEQSKKLQMRCCEEI